MQIVWGDERNPAFRQAVISWLSSKIWPDENRQLKDGVVMAVFDGDAIAGACAYSEWNGNTGVVEISAAASSRKWMTRRSVHEMFDYPFRDLKCQMVVARVSARPEQAHLHRICRSLGFTEILIPRIMGRDEDGILFSLTDDTWNASKFERSTNV